MIPYRITSQFENNLYLVFLFLLPTQLGKHFWPPFSFVGGFRVDYLSPTLYLTDLVLFFIFCLWVYRLLRRKNKDENKQLLELLRTPLLLLLVSCLFFSGVLAKNPNVVLYGTVKFLEMVFLGIYTAVVIGKRISYSAIGIAVGGGMCMEGVLAITQFFSHGSLGGLWYFFGERTFSSLTPGIANASIRGQLVLRPYGTLPHPNVLAGYLLLSGIFIVGLWQHYAFWQRVVILIALVLGGGALFLSLSRIAILLFCMLLIVSVFLFIKNRKKQIVVCLLGMVGGLIGLRIFGTVVFNRFASTSFLEESFLVRVDLVKNAWWMIQTNPVFGVGLMNFLVRLPSFAHPYTFYQYLQPVHNMYLLLASEIGIVGLVLSLWFLYKTVCHVQAAPFSSQRTACFLLVASILFLGLFDHYFLTLQAGQLLLAFIFGSCWSLPQKKRQRRNPLNKK
jgi:hypothetical protein